MEENKYLCPKCGTRMNETYVKPALNLVCPKCGCKIATTKWGKIDLDDTTYEIYLKPLGNISIDQIKYVSKVTGLNFIESKSIILNGKLLFSGKAKEIKNIKQSLECQNLEYSISPKYIY